ncbi:shikimate kinase [Enterococcus sp. DIV0876]|uniref:shikimate kinase n=1 Tax=Enterococcus sp. DIV0876 TaxID=2774633 RepID=UPI003D2FE63B
MNGIVLIGFMGAGKTTIGGLLAKETGMMQIDFDDLITAEIGMSIQDFFALHGESAFREIETRILAQTLTRPEIISTGGGIVLKEENRQLLKKMPRVIYLKTDPAELINRLQADTKNVRPLVLSKTPTEILAVYQPRIPFYEESASLVVETTGKAPHEIVTEILAKVGE